MSKIKAAIIGCGTIANSAHAPSYDKNPETEIGYCIDIIPERARSLADRFGNELTRTSTDYRVMLHDPDIDVVSVCVPNHLHADISIECLAAGKHVLCEKPAALDFNQTLRMKRSADENQRILNIGVCNRFNAAVNHVRDLIQNGDLGNIYHIYCSFRSHRSIPGLGGPFTTKSLSGGGVLIDWGVHFLDLINYCIGNRKLKTVSGSTYGLLGKNKADYIFTEMWAGPPDLNGIYDVEDFVTGLIRTEGPTISLNGAWAQNIRESGMYLEFLGDKSGIRLQYGGDFTIDAAKDGMLTHTLVSLKQTDMYYDEIDAFVQSASSGVKNRANIDEILITAEMMDRLYQSAMTGCEVICT